MGRTRGGKSFPAVHLCGGAAALRRAGACTRSADDGGGCGLRPSHWRAELFFRPFFAAIAFKRAGCGGVSDLQRGALLFSERLSRRQAAAMWIILVSLALLNL